MKLKAYICKENSIKNNKKEQSTDMYNNLDESPENMLSNVNP